MSNQVFTYWDFVKHEYDFEFWKAYDHFRTTFKPDTQLIIFCEDIAKEKLYERAKPFLKTAKRTTLWRKGLE